MNRSSKKSLAHAVVLSALGLLVGGCSEGVDLAKPTPAPEMSHLGDVFSESSNVNGAANSHNEPYVRTWIPSARSVQASCSGISQGIEEAFHTSAFEKNIDKNGTAYLLATRSQSREIPEYIEFCVTVDTLSDYRILVDVRADSIYEDSYFITIDELSAGTDSAPGIYDVSRSDVFKQDTVRTRTRNPLEVTLGVGEHILRFYYREPNVALQGIQLIPLVSDTPVLDPEAESTTMLAQCANNTGLSESAIENLLDTYIGNVDRRFVLQPSKQNTGYTVRNDWRWETQDGRGNIMCLSTPPVDGFNLVDNTIPAGRLVIGSQGPDVQKRATPLLGTFVGNAGNDSVGVMQGGVFDAGEGEDAVFLMYGGIFLGGSGDDEIISMRDGEFVAGGGNDEVGAQFAGTFDGGIGEDSVARQSVNGISVDVEAVELLFNPLLAPTNLRIVNPLADNVLLTWDASPDARTEGYVISVRETRVPSVAADFGEQLNNVSLIQTGQTRIPLAKPYTDDAVFLLRAYTQLSEDRFLYSEPVALDYQAPTDDMYAAGVTVLGSVQLDYVVEEARLLSGTEVLAGVESQYFIDANSPLYVALADDVSRETPIFESSLAADDYRHHMADSVQYVVTFPFQAPPRVHALSSDGKTTLWTNGLSLPPFLQGENNPGRSQCTRAIVTQDDHLACIPLRGGVELFNPEGGADAFVGADIDYYAELVDGEDGVIAYLNSTRRTPLTTMSLVIPALQLQEEIPLAMSSVLNTDERAEPVGLALSNGSAIISGVIMDDRCRLNNNNCVRFEDDRLAYFIARASLATGELSDFQRFDLEQSIGTGVGKVTGEEVVFFGQNIVMRYQLDSLQLIERTYVPGSVLDVSAEAVISRGFRNEPSTTRSELYLIER